MLIHWDGKKYEYDPAKIDVKTAIAISQHTGLGMRSWGRAIDDADPIALQALLWVVKSQNGEREPIKTVDFSPLEFWEAVVAATRDDLVDRLTAKEAAKTLGVDEAKALEVLRGEAPPEEMPDPTVTAD